MEPHYGFSNPVLVQSIDWRFISPESIFFFLISIPCAIFIIFFITKYENYRKTHIPIKFIPQVEDEIISIYHTYIELGYYHDAQMMEKALNVDSVLSTLLVTIDVNKTGPILNYCKKYHKELYEEFSPVIAELLMQH